MSTPVRSDRDYTREIVYDAPSERVFDALATLDGLAGWWTPIVRGTPTAGGELEFGFSGLDEKIVMRVDEARRPSSVVWSCLTHTGHPEWQGTTIVFELTQADHHQSGALKFRHVGLSPTLNCYETCESGWDHFLTRRRTERAVGRVQFGWSEHRLLADRRADLRPAEGKRSDDPAHRRAQLR